MSPASRALSGGVAIVATAAYCGWFWSQGRRTLAMNYAWALLDPQRRFLQDRLAGTRLVRAP